MSGFQRAAVIGLGLLGGSTAAALKRTGLARQVVGASRSADARRTARAQGWVDEVGDAADAARGADLVILATPVYAMADVLRAIAGGLAPGAIVTDVGSVKAPLVETLPGLLPAGATYIGSHPMAGSHNSGIEHATPDLFEGAACIVTEGPAEPRERVCALWRAVGGRVVLRDAADHDAEVAWTSHVPHAVAFAFAAAFGHAPAGAREVAGSGFRDFTRIARSETELWTDILAGNRKAISAPLANVAQALGELARAIDANDTDAIEQTIARARDGLALVTSDAANASARGAAASPERETNLAPTGDGHRSAESTRTPGRPATPAGAGDEKTTHE